MSSIGVCLNGASGRMGLLIDRACDDVECGVRVTARNTRSAPIDGRKREVDVVIDFSSDAGALWAADFALKTRCALLMGTTGLSDATREVLLTASKSIPVMIAPNTSIGIAVMRHLVAESARYLSGDFKVSLSEVHHTQKRDRPSGTALLLAQAVTIGSGIPLEQLQIHSIREGEVVGDHEVTFLGRSETLTIRHHAHSRDLFATGALRLARWIHKQPSGMYGVDDWFGGVKKTTP